MEFKDYYKTLSLSQDASQEEVKELLIRQAGEDLGLAPEAVEAHVLGVLRDEQDEAGGALPGQPAGRGPAFAGQADNEERLRSEERLRER